MKRFTPKKTALLLACVTLAVAGCHRNQSAQSTQNTAAQSSTASPQSQSATQPMADPNATAATAPN